MREDRIWRGWVGSSISGTVQREQPEYNGPTSYDWQREATDRPSARHRTLPTTTTRMTNIPNRKHTTTDVRPRPQPCNHRNCQEHTNTPTTQWALRPTRTFTTQENEHSTRQTATSNEPQGGTHMGKDANASDHWVGMTGEHWLVWHMQLTRVNGVQQRASKGPTNISREVYS